MTPTNLKSETIGVLRNCDLMGATYVCPCTGDVRHFVRCCPLRADLYRGEDGAAILARCMADLKATNMADGCCIAHNDNYGGDYLQVTRGSPAHRLICHLKS